MCHQQEEELHEKRHGMRNRRRNVYMPPLKYECFGSAAYKHNRPRSLRVVNSGIHAPYPLDLGGATHKPLKPAFLIPEHLEHHGPCRQRAPSSLEIVGFAFKKKSERDDSQPRL